MSDREARNRIVFIPDEDTMGLLEGPMGAFFSTVRYIKHGIEHEVLIENDDFILVEDLKDSDDGDNNDG